MRTITDPRLIGLAENPEPDEWCADESDMYACECDQCGKQVRNTENLLVMLDVSGKPVRICGDCQDEMTPTELLDALGYRYYEGDAADAEPVVTGWAADAMTRGRKGRRAG